MNAIRRVINQKVIYFIAFLTGVTPALLLICSTSKIGCFLKLNVFHNFWMDRIFINLTFLGDGIFSIIAAILLLFIWKMRRLSFHIIVAYLFSGIAAQVLKHLYMAPRPREIIVTSLYKSFFNGISGAGWDSFPSGHTTSIFALATVLALHANKRAWSLLYLFIAALVGYSRIYLGQHFLQDVIAGACLGTMVGVIVFTYLNFRQNRSREESFSDNPNEVSYSTPGT